MTGEAPASAMHFIIARPACPSNENKRVYSFILFILPFCPRLGRFPMFFFVFFWLFFFGVLQRYIHFGIVVAHHCTLFFTKTVCFANLSTT